MLSYYHVAPKTIIKDMFEHNLLGKELQRKCQWGGYFALLSQSCSTFLALNSKGGKSDYWSN
jgi:hypothetical protein